MSCSRTKRSTQVKKYNNHRNKNAQGEPRTILRKLTCRGKYTSWENKKNKTLREEEEVEERPK